MTFTNFGQCNSVATWWPMLISRLCCLALNFGRKKRTFGENLLRLRYLKVCHWAIGATSLIRWKFCIKSTESENWMKFPLKSRVECADCSNQLCQLESRTRREPKSQTSALFLVWQIGFFGREKKMIKWSNWMKIRDAGMTLLTADRN